jgi:hypothetical protein
MGTHPHSAPEPLQRPRRAKPLTNAMELAVLEPATSWVRYGAVWTNVRARIRLYRGESARAASAATITRWVALTVCWGGEMIGS